MVGEPRGDRQLQMYGSQGVVGGEVQCTSVKLSLWQAESVFLAFVVEGGFQLTASGYVDGEASTSFVLRSNGKVADATGNIDVPPLLVDSLEGHSSTRASDEMTALGEEIDDEALVEILVDTRLRTSDNRLLAIVATLLGALVDGHDAAVDGAEEAEEGCRRVRGSAGWRDVR